MDKAKVQELANDLMFSVNDDEIKDIIKEFESLDKMISFFDSINTDKVEEMVYPLDVETTYLREDKENHKISQEEALANVKKTKQGHILVPKVVK